MTSVWVFDIDDTLYLERDYVRSGFNAVDEWARETMSLKGVGDQAWKLFLEGGRKSTLNDSFTILGRRLSDQETSDVVAVYRGHKPAINLCADARAALERLCHNSKIAIITDGPPVSQRAKVAALGLEAFADPIIITGEHGTGWHKPGMHSFAYVESVFGATPERCVYVADNPLKDFISPSQRGWRTVRIRRPGGLHATSPSVRGEVSQSVTSLASLGIPNHSATGIN